MNYISALSKVELLYWKAPKCTIADGALLLSSNALLIALTQKITYNSDKDDVVALSALIILLLQYVLSVVVLFRGRSIDSGNDIPKLMFVLLVAWVISLAFFLLAYICGFSYSDLKGDHADSILLVQIGTSVVFGGASVLLISVHSVTRYLRKVHKYPGARHGEGRYRNVRNGRGLQILKWAFIIFVLNSVLFFGFVLSEDVRSRLEAINIF